MFSKTRLGVLLVLLLLLAYMTFLGRGTLLETKDTTDLYFSSECDLNSTSCSLHLAEQFMLTFRLKPKKIVPLERFELLISSDNESFDQIEALAIWFEGRDMDMGRQYLRPLKGLNNAGSSLLAQGMIPVCTVDPDMVWRLVVEFNYQGKRMHVSFDVLVQAQGS